MDADRARIRRPEPRDAFHCGGLASTIGSYNSKDLAMLYREGYIIDGDEIPVSFYEVLNRDCLFRLLLTHHHILRWMNSKITRLLQRDRLSAWFSWAFAGKRVMAEKC